MDLTDVVICKNKNGICSLGIQINSELANNDVFILNSKKKYFRDNLGIPLPLYLFNKQYEEILDVIDFNEKNPIEETYEDTYEESKCIDDTLYDKLISLASKKKSKPKTRKSKTKKTKSKSKTRKNKN